jgi:hypothetical protein
MAINLNRNEVLSLMKELDPEHWIQGRLLIEIVLMDRANEPVEVAKISSNLSEPIKIQKTSTEAISETDAPKELKQCKHSTYGYRCRKESENEYCEDHLNKLCTTPDALGNVCGKQSDHGCPEELQFVCGTPCCPEHSRCGRHKSRYSS